MANYHHSEEVTAVAHGGYVAPAYATDLQATSTPDTLLLDVAAAAATTVAARGTEPPKTHNLGGFLSAVSPPPEPPPESQPELAYYQPPLLREFPQAQPGCPRYDKHPVLGHSPAPHGRQPRVACRGGSDETFGSSFDDEGIRRAFIMKVYTILSVQLAFTSGVVMIFVLVEPINSFVKKFSILFVVIGLFCSAISFVLYFVLVCFSSVRRSFPCNFILLSAFTFFYTFPVAFLSVGYPLNAVLYVFVITTIVCVLVSLFAVVAPCDITGCGMVLYMMFLALSVFSVFAGIVAMIYETSILQLVLSGLMVLLMCTYLMFDTQLIIGGRRMELSPEEYVYGAIQLYVDIVLIFIYMLRTLAAFLVDDDD